MKIAINAKTYNLPSELVAHINGQQREIDTLESEVRRLRKTEADRTKTVDELFDYELQQAGVGSSKMEHTTEGGAE